MQEIPEIIKKSIYTHYGVARLLEVTPYRLQKWAKEEVKPRNKTREKIEKIMNFIKETNPIRYHPFSGS